MLKTKWGFQPYATACRSRKQLTVGSQRKLQVMPRRGDKGLVWGCGQKQYQGRMLDNRKYTHDTGYNDCLNNTHLTTMSPDR